MAPNFGRPIWLPAVTGKSTNDSTIDFTLDSQRIPDKPKMTRVASTTPIRAMGWNHAGQHVGFKIARERGASPQRSAGLVQFICGIGSEDDSQQSSAMAQSVGQFGTRPGSNWLGFVKILLE
jgi:hypothetical protein